MFKAANNHHMVDSYVQPFCLGVELGQQKCPPASDLRVRLHDIFGGRRRRAPPPPNFAKVVAEEVPAPKVKADLGTCAGWGAEGDSATRDSIPEPCFDTMQRATSH